jgi:hypothetical protein
MVRKAFWTKFLYMTSPPCVFEGLVGENARRGGQQVRGFGGVTPMLFPSTHSELRGHDYRDVDKRVRSMRDRSESRTKQTRPLTPESEDGLHAGFAPGNGKRTISYAQSDADATAKNRRVHHSHKVVRDVVEDQTESGALQKVEKTEDDLAGGVEKIGKKDRGFSNDNQQDTECGMDVHPVGQPVDVVGRRGALKGQARPVGREDPSGT